jgi:hypothetical protein
MAAQDEKKVYESNYLVGKNCLAGSVDAAFAGLSRVPGCGP